MVSVDRETKVISAILFATLLSLIGARYLDRQSFVDWSDVEKIAEYDREATIGDTIEIRYYLVNDRPYAIKVKPELNYFSTIYYSSDPDKRTLPSFGEGPDDPYFKIPAKSKERIHSVHYVAERAGRLIIDIYGYPDVQIDVLPEYSEDELTKINLLQLRLQPDEEEYRLGETANVSVCLVNPFPHPVLVETPSFFMFNGDFEDQLELLIEVVTFNPEGEPLTIEPDSELILDICSIKPSEQGLFTLHAKLASQRRLRGSDPGI